MAIKTHHSIAVNPGRWIASELVEPGGLSVTDLAQARTHETDIRVKPLAA